MCQLRRSIPSIRLVVYPPYAGNPLVNITDSSLIPIRMDKLNPTFGSPKTDNCRHIKRVLSYARPSDYAVGAATASAGPGLMLLMEKISPSLVGKGGFAPILRLSGAIGLGAGFVMFYQRSICTFPSLLKLLYSTMASNSLLQCGFMVLQRTSGNKTWT